MGGGRKADAGSPPGSRSRLTCPCPRPAPGKEEPRVVGPGVQGIDVGCGERIRTSDLRVMSPTSCRCSTPRPITLGPRRVPVKRGQGASASATASSNDIDRPSARPRSNASPAAVVRCSRYCSLSASHWPNGARDDSVSTAPHSRPAAIGPSLLGGDPCEKGHRIGHPLAVADRIGDAECRDAEIPCLGRSVQFEGDLGRRQQRADPHPAGTDLVGEVGAAE